MASGSPRPPDIGRRGPHQVRPARQASARAATRDRCEPATSSPSPSSERSDDMRPADAPGRPAPRRKRRLPEAPPAGSTARRKRRPPEAPSGACAQCAARVPALGALASALRPGPSHHTPQNLENSQ